MSPTQLVDYADKASGPTVLLMCLILVLVAYTRGVWMLKPDCTKQLEEKDAELKRLRATIETMQARMEEERKELFNLALRGTEQAAIQSRVIAALKAAKTP
jgi:hypothetical protein